MNQSHQARPVWISRNRHVKIIRFEHKTHFHALLNSCLQIKNKVFLIELVTFFHVNFTYK